MMPQSSFCMKHPDYLQSYILCKTTSENTSTENTSIPVIWNHTQTELILKMAALDNVISNN